MKREDLTKLGLTDDAVIDAIMTAHGKDVEKQKAAVETSKTELDTLKTQLTEANKAIEGFKKMDVDGIKAAADDYKAKYEQAQKDAADQVAAVRFDHALERELKEVYKVKDPRDVIPHLKRDTLKLDEDKFIGLKEQIEPLKSAKDYLFADTVPPPKIVTGATSKSVVGDPIIDAARKAAGLSTEQK